MIKECLVCGNLFDTTKTGRYKYCSEKCAKSRNNNNYPRDLSTFGYNNPMQVELEGDGYADRELVYDYGKCPKCGWEFEEGDKDWEEPYCCHCGQRLKWFENTEKVRMKYEKVFRGIKPKTEDEVKSPYPYWCGEDVRCDEIGENGCQYVIGDECSLTLDKKEGRI